VYDAQASFSDSRLGSDEGRLVSQVNANKENAMPIKTAATTALCQAGGRAILSAGVDMRDELSDDNVECQANERELIFRSNSRTERDRQDDLYRVGVWIFRAGNLRARGNAGAINVLNRLLSKVSR
jgi:hypothetical protein